MASRRAESLPTEPESRKSSTAESSRRSKSRSTEETSSQGSGRGTRASSKSSKQLQTVLAVFPETKGGNKAYAALEAAVRDLKSTQLERLPFEKLDYGEMASLDRFYAANVVVVDVTERTMQAPLFYQLGLRENFDMKNNVVTALDLESAFGAGGKESIEEQNASASAVSVYMCAIVV